jgi:hypothetical protein
MFDLGVCSGNILTNVLSSICKSIIYNIKIFISQCKFINLFLNSLYYSKFYTFFFISLPNQAGEELKTHKQKKRLLATQNEYKYGLALTTL